MSCVKLFPAHVVGGPAAVSALGGPFPDLEFVPTGGVNASNLAGYLALPNVLAVGGTWMLPATTLAARDWSALEQAVREAVSAADTIRPRTGALS